MLLSRLIDIMITLKKALASPGSRGGGRGGVVGSRGPGVGWGIATFLPNCNKTPFEGSLRAFSGTVFQMFQALQKRIVGVPICSNVPNVPSIDKLPILWYNKIGG